jgi:glycosyltransferase involved in cell wall biosynthesis
MKRILICSDSFLPRWDGISRFLTELIPEISDEFDIHVIVPKFPGEFKPIDRVKVTRVPLLGIKAADYAFPKMGASHIKKEVMWADTVWTHTIGPIGAAGILNGRRQGKSVIAFIHSIDWELFPKSLSQKYIQGIVHQGTKLWARYLYNKCKLIMVPTLEVGEILRNNHITTPTKPIFLGVNAGKFMPPKSKAEAKEALGFKPTDRIVGYCGRIGREKNLITLYRAFLRARKQIGNLYLLIVGSGIKDWDKLLNANEGVVHVGSQDNVVPFLQALDAYVLPSLTETTSLSTLEAMACGVPVLVTRVGLVRDYVVEGKNGMFFPMQDSYMLSKIMVEIFKDDIKRERMGASARRTVAEMYSFDKTVQDVVLTLEVF